MPRSTLSFDHTSGLDRSSCDKGGGECPGHVPGITVPTLQLFPLSQNTAAPQTSTLGLMAGQGDKSPRFAKTSLLGSVLCRAYLGRGAA